jgi:nucleoside-diphosphate-sugar epimerase
LKALLVGFGDLARRLSGRLLDGGWQVRGMKRNPARVAGVEMCVGDCRDVPALVDALSGVDAVVVTLTPGEFTESAYRETYVESARSLAEALARCADGPRRVLWVSSTSVYGRGDGEWVDEDTPTHPEKFSGRCLLEAEDLIRRAPVPATVVRFSGIYGPGRRRMIGKVAEGEVVPPSPPVWTNRIHSDDCAGVLYHFLEASRAGQELPPLVLGTDCEPATLHDVQCWLAEAMGVTIRGEAPPPGSRGNRRCSNQRLLAAGYRFRYPTFREGYRALLAERDGGTAASRF